MCHSPEHWWCQNLLFVVDIECSAGDNGDDSSWCIGLAEGPYRAFTVRGGGGNRDMSCKSSSVRACYLSVILSVQLVIMERSVPSV